MKKNWLFLLPAAALLLIFAKCDDEEEQTVDLPAAIKTYLSTHYPGAEIEASEIDTLCTGTAVYEVEVEISDDNEKDLTFNTEGNLLFTEAEIKTGELPPAVSGSINANFTGYTTAEAERLDLTGGGVQYEVELQKSGQPTLSVLFSADGAVVCQEEEGNDDDE